ETARRAASSPSPQRQSRVLVKHSHEEMRAATTRRAWSAALKENAADQLHLQFAGVRVETGLRALATIAVDLQQFGAEPQPADRGPAARQCEGAAVLARASHAKRITRLCRKQIDPTGDAEVIEVIPGEQVDRLEIGRAVEIADGLDVGVSEHGLAQDHDIAEISLQSQAGEPRAPAEIAADMGGRIGAVVVIERGQAPELVLPR